VSCWRSIASEQELRVILKTVASQGWCLLDEELEEGVRSLAVPRHDKQGAVIAAMNVCAHASRVSAEGMQEEFLPPLLQAAAMVDQHTVSKA
jgi:IclR family pca regulon transcriptional regulator